MNFAERYSGVKHEDDLEKQVMVNQNNLDKERIKQDTQLNMQENIMANDMANKVLDTGMGIYNGKSF